MAVRSTLSNLIMTLRGMAHVSDSDYSINAVDYWSDQQLQDILDRNRLDLWRYPLTKIPRASANLVQYFDHQIEGYQNFEQTSGGTAIFVIEDSAGNDQGTALWSADYNTGMVTFTQDTAGTVLYVNARTYDLNGAAADVWRQKAGHHAISYDFSTDNMSVRRSQQITQAQQMTQYYASQARAKTAQIFRSDNAGPY